MNFRGGVALIRKSLFCYMASRGFFWTLAVSWMMGPLVFLFVWVSAVGEGNVGGLDKSDFIFYYLCIILVNQLTYPTSHWIIGENIQIGTLSTWLMRPLPVIFEAVASDIALKIVCLPPVILITAILAISMDFGVSLSWLQVILFIPALLMAGFLRFFTAYAMALLAFWTQKISALLSVNDVLVFLLAGQVAPTTLLPGILGTASVFLPFRYMLGFPVEIITGMLNESEILSGLIIQAVWLIGAAVVQKVIFRSGIRRFAAIGG